MPMASAVRRSGLPIGIQFWKLLSHFSFTYRTIKLENCADQKGVSLVNEVEIYAKLKDVFSDVFDDEEIQLSPTLTAKDIDGWDSLTHIRLMLTIEKAFKVKFSTSEIGNLKNVGDLVALIQARM
jgi:acyl carrier protein